MGIRARAPQFLGGAIGSVPGGDRLEMPRPWQVPGQGGPPATTTWPSSAQPRKEPVVEDEPTAHGRSRA